MDDLQDVLARVGLASLGRYGFALAGGYALQAYGLVERMSEDVDLFTDRWDPETFSQAVAAVLDAYRRAGLELTVVRSAETFARLRVLDPSSGREGSVDLAADARSHEPAILAIGPVLAEPDAVATKVAAVFSRGYARDYLDLAGILASGRHSRDDLIGLASEVDGGFDRAIFAEALAGVDRFADDEYARYGADAGLIARVREALRSWSEQIQQDIAHEASVRQTDGPSVEDPAIDNPNLGI